MNRAVESLTERAIREHWDFLPAAWRIMSTVAWRRGIHPYPAAPTLAPGAD